MSERPDIDAEWKKFFDQHIATLQVDARAACLILESERDDQIRRKRQVSRKLGKAIKLLQQARPYVKLPALAEKIDAIIADKYTRRMIATKGVK